MRKRKLACWLLVPAMTLWIGSGFGAGKAGAFYYDTVSRQTAVWDTFVQSESEMLSDCLVPGGQIVLLGKVTETQWIPFHVQTDGFSQFNLECRLLDPQMQNYLFAMLSDPMETDTPGEIQVYLVVVPSDAAYGLTSDLQVDVLVTFTQNDLVLEGIFRLVIPAGQEGSAENGLLAIEEPAVPMSFMFKRSRTSDSFMDNSQPNGEDSSDNPYEIDPDTDVTPVPPPTENPSDDPYDVGSDTEILPVLPPPVIPTPNPPSPGDGSGGPSDDPYDVGSDTEILPVVPPGEDPDPDLPPPGEEPGGPSDDPYDIGSDTEILPVDPPGEEPGGPSDDPYDVGSDTEILPVDPPGEEPGGPSDDPYDVGSDTEILPVEPLIFRTPEYSSIGMIVPIVIELPEDCISVVVSCPDGEMPPFTRYSPDGGRTWFLLYYGGEIHVAADELSAGYMGEQCLLLDLSQTGLSGGEAIQITIRASAPKAIYEGDFVLYPEMAFLGVGDEAFVLTSGGSFVVRQPQSSVSCSNQIRLERLMADGADVEYVMVPEEQINVTFYDGAIEVSSNALSLPAGTYRLTVAYFYEGVVLSRSQITFFVNYPTAMRWG